MKRPAYIKVNNAGVNICENRFVYALCRFFPSNSIRLRILTSHVPGVTTGFLTDLFFSLALFRIGFNISSLRVPSFAKGKLERSGCYHDKVAHLGRHVVDNEFKRNSGEASDF